MKSPSRMLRATSTAIGVAALIATSLPTATANATANATAQATAQATAISCETTQSGNDATFYDGPSASNRYDGIFSSSATVPHLETHTPQGAATWPNWDGTGAGRDLLLLSAYQAGNRSLIIGIDPATGATVQSASIPETHAGGIAVSGDWAFVSGPDNAAGSATIAKYRLSDLKLAMNHAGSPLLVEPVGAAVAVYGSGFLTAADGYLYAGRFELLSRGHMYRYQVGADGSLAVEGDWIEVPKLTQGMTVTATHFIYSTSYDRDFRSNLYAVRRGHQLLDDSVLGCFRAPSMTEGIATVGANAYLVYESGSHLYNGTDGGRALNVIRALHKAPVASLTALAP